MSNFNKIPEVSDHVTSDSPTSLVGTSMTALPSGWRYKSLHWSFFRIPYYASPKAQLILVAFVCFFCPGMFNALNGMGGGGQIDTFTSNAANAALYAAFAVTAFMCGSICNTIGVKTCLSLGGLGYSLYIASFLCYNFTSNSGFCIFAGALLGVCAGCLWTAQGSIMMSYPKEDSKGHYIAWFWVIFNFGGVLGGLIPLGTNIHRDEAATVNNGTYVGFLVLTFFGACLSFTLCRTNDVVRTDGSRVIMMRHPSWKTELKAMFGCLRTDWYIVGFFPMFLASNWFYTYQFNDVNAVYFTVRTRALNSILYWLAQMIGAVIFGYSLDWEGLRRSTKAKISWAVLFCFTLAIWGGGYDFEKRFTREQAAAADFKTMDWTSYGYAGPMLLYVFYGFFDSIWQTCVYWYLGSLTNNSRKLANFAGFYKGIQSAGGAIAFGLDAAKIPYITEFFICWGLLLLGLVAAAPVLWFKIDDSIDLEEDVKFSDESYEDVAPTAKRNESIELRNRAREQDQARYGQASQQSGDQAIYHSGYEPSNHSGSRHNGEPFYEIV